MKSFEKEACEICEYLVANIYRVETSAFMKSMPKNGLEPTLDDNYKK